MRRPAARYAIIVAAVFLVLAVGVVSSLYLVGRSVDRSQRQWCDTLAVLTARPVPQPADPAKYPAQEENYLIWRDLLELKHRFGC